MTGLSDGFKQRNTPVPRCLSMGTGLDAWQVTDCIWQGHDKLLGLRGGLVSAPICSCTMGQAEDSMEHGGFFCGVKLRHLDLALGLSKRWLVGDRLWMSCLVFYLRALAKAWRKFMFCIAHLCKNKNSSNYSFSKFLSNTEVCWPVIVSA